MGQQKLSEKPKYNMDLSNRLQKDNICISAYLPIEEGETKRETRSKLSKLLIQTEGDLADIMSPFDIKAFLRPIRDTLTQMNVKEDCRGLAFFMSQSQLECKELEKSPPSMAFVRDRFDTQLSPKASF